MGNSSGGLIKALRTDEDIEESNLEHLIEENILDLEKTDRVRIFLLILFKLQCLFEISIIPNVGGLHCTDMGDKERPLQCSCSITEKGIKSKLGG